MQPTSLAPGSVIDGRFQILEAVAQGGMGTVLRARDLERDETVACKILFGRDRTALARFGRERQLLQDLRHPGIVRYVAHGTLEDGHPYLVMEWLHGEDLSHRLAQKPLSLGETVALGVAIASALEAAHSSGIIHRDIKPANLFLQGGEAHRVKLLDFGIARLFGAEAATRTGTVVGTPDYMAPEQVRGDREIDARADLFSLGCVLYECLAGSPPFASDQIMGVFGKILFEPAPDLGQKRPDLPPELRKLIATLLEKDRARRPPRAAEVLKEIMSIPESELQNPSRAVGTPSRPRGLTTHEQRLLSIVVVAARPLVTEDAPTVSASPEQTWMKLLRDIGQPFGARVDQTPDGSVLALITGQPTARDQAKQAARLALRLRERFAQQNEATQNTVPQIVRTAVCTGRGDLERGVLDAGSIERAIGLIGRISQLEKAQSESGVRPSEFPIVLDEMTRGLLDSRFLMHAASGVTLLVSEQPIAEPVRLVLGKSTPFFGRERELGLLNAVWNDCLDEPCARVSLITADAGMGKSRLCQEFLQRVAKDHPETTVWIGRGEPLRAGSPFGLLADTLRQALALPEGTAEDVQRQRIGAYIDRQANLQAPERAREKPRLREFLAELLSLESEAAPSRAMHAARLDPMLMGDQIRRAVLDLLDAECKNRPLLWVLEDLHWGDLPTVRLIDAALRQLAERPFFVLALARPTVHDVFPRLWEGRSPQEIRLTGLSRRASERIARAVLGNTEQVDSVLGLLERAGGNAFFLEEMLRAAAEGQLGEAPATVLAMVQSRIERLEPQARRVLRAACVFGPVFWRGGVLRLLGSGEQLSEVTEWLDTLLERELINRRPESRIAGDTEYSFVHALARDAAYAMLTDADRRLGHRLAARYLEEAGERDAVVLAEHWERSGELLPAIAWYKRAAWQALEGNDLDSVLLHAARAIACGAGGIELGEVSAAQAEAQLWRGEYHETIRLGSTALSLLPPKSPRWFQAIGAMTIAAGRITDGGLLAELCTELLKLAPQGEVSEEFLTAAVRMALQLFILGEYVQAQKLIDSFSRFIDKEPQSRSPAFEAMVCLLRANRAVSEWQLDVAVAYYEQSAMLFEQIGDLRNASSQKLDAAFFYMDLGNFTRTEELCQQIIDIAERLGLTRLSTVAYGARAINYFWMGRHDEVFASYAPLMDRARATNDRRILSAGYMLNTRELLHRGDLEAAQKAAESALAEVHEMPRFRARALALYSRVLLAMGRLQEARSSIELSYAIFKDLGRLGTDEALIHTTYAEVLMKLGETELANELLRTARSRLLSQADCIADPQAKKGFLSLIDHAHLLRITEGM